MFNKISNKFKQLYNLYLVKDPFAINAKKWFDDNGDDTLRLNYPLNQSSIVIDIGGYIGDYAEAINNKYGCQVLLFEPVPEFYDKCLKRFKDNPSISCYNYGLSSKTDTLEIELDANSSSFIKKNLGKNSQLVQVRSILEVFEELKLDQIDLIKINIEGGEYDLLPEIISSGIVKKVKYLQIQFHTFANNAVEYRLQILDLLSKTHHQMWNYEFIWESWELT